MPDLREEIIDDEAIVDAWLESTERPPSKDRVNHASKIGHPCDRYLVLKRTHGDKAAPPSRRLRAIFKRGHALEQPVAVAQLQAAGWKTWDEQRTFDVMEKGETIISCRIDCITRRPGSEATYVVDHKIVNPYDWEKIPRGWDGYDFLRASEKPWLRAWPAQVMSYMYAHPGSATVGLLQLINAETLIPKFVYVPFDVDYMQWILDRGIRLNAAAKEVLLHGIEKLPAPIDWDEMTCGRCEMLGTCLPDQVGREPLELIEDESFIELIEQDRKLAEERTRVNKEFDWIHDRVKHMVGERSRLAVGDRYVITTKTVNVKERVQKAFSYLRLDIKPLGVKESEQEEGAA